MAKSSTIWVSRGTKNKADAHRGKMSYNKHYSYLIERVKELERIKGAPIIQKVQSVDTDIILRRMESLSQSVESVKAASTGQTQPADIDRIIYAVDLMRKSISSLADRITDVSSMSPASEKVDYDRIGLMVSTETKKIINNTFDEMLASVEQKIAGLNSQIEKVQKAAAIATTKAENYDYCTVCATYTTDAYHWKMHQKVPRNPFTMLV